MQDLAAVLNRWKSSTTDRQKLQHAYLLLTLTVVIVAGIVGLVNAQTGRDIVRLALVFLGAFFVNMVIWSLLSSIVISRLTSRSRRR